jgi:hypothetical protein
MSITRSEAQAPFGNSARALSIFLGIDHTTVAHWDCNEPIPPHHQWRLATALPNYFESEREKLERINADGLLAAYAYMERFGLTAIPPPARAPQVESVNDTVAPSTDTTPDGR